MHVHRLNAGIGIKPVSAPSLRLQLQILIRRFEITKQDCLWAYSIQSNGYYSG
jgi:hypothetical protein